MRILFPLAVVLSATSAHAEIISAFTDLNVETHCSTIDQAKDGDGDWSDLVCNGWKGYPVHLTYGDARESIAYGFPRFTGARAPFESFNTFNTAGNKIEWRIEKTKEYERPFATILRWRVNADAEGNTITEVLVISKVASPTSGEGCVIGHVVASKDPKSNEKAQKLADEKARTFKCGKDKSTAIADGAPLPEPMLPTGP